MENELNKIRDKIITDYSNKAALRFSEYETGRVEHCQYFQHYIAKPPAHILDIGSGSSRDAAYYAQQGYKVTAIEPATELKKLAQQKYRHLDITWIDDLLPELANIKSKGILFDHIHMNAVIFHLPKEYTKASLESAASILKENGTLYLSLRYGPTDNERPMFEIDKDHIFSEITGIFELLENNHKPDNLRRPGISWDRMLLKKL